MNTIFEISALENSQSTKFHQNRKTLVFGHFLGAEPKKNIKKNGLRMFGQKC